jgi:putative aminopeptidase FrvX
MSVGPLATPGVVVPAADEVQWCHDLSQVAAQRGAYRDMRADSTSVRSAGHTNQAAANASSTGSAAPRAGTSADSTQARRSTEGPTIVGVRSGTVLDPKLVAELRAVAARTDIAQRVLTILEPGQGPKSPVAARRYGS